MPARNTVKKFVENAYYHIYNRGVEKRNIFQDEKDYKVFLHFLKLYLEEPAPHRVQPFGGLNPRKSLNKEISLLVYCLMPNHFHLLVKQKTKDAITKFMRRICTNYVMYFNNRHERVGSLFQGIYKGVLVETEEQLLHLSRYIHLNPMEPSTKRPSGFNPLEYPYSSYAEYLGKRRTKWINTQEILSYFKTAQRTSLKDMLSYETFVEDYKEKEDSVQILKGLILEALEG